METDKPLGQKRPRVVFCLAVFFRVVVWPHAVISFIIITFKIFIYLFNLVAPGLSCGRWAPSLRLQGSLVVACELSVAACTWDLVPRPGIEPGPLHWERGVLTTVPPGKSLLLLFLKHNMIIF